jgi:predicted  nucleic acid-binding Zn-ribbon protein
VLSNSSGENTLLTKYNDVKNCLSVTHQVNEHPELCAMVEDFFISYMDVENLIRDAQVTESTTAVADRRKAEAMAQKAMAEAAKEKRERERLTSENSILLERLAILESRVAGLETTV